MNQSDQDSVDPADVAQFERLGDAWWDLEGPMATLHRFNPVRVAWVVERAAKLSGGDPAAPLSGLRVLDIGCGGGILCEPLARLGARVTGVDPAPGNVEAARRHADEMGLAIDYRATTAEALREAGERFDVVLAMEVVEHVTSVPGFVAAAGALVAPGGLFFAATLNRTALSFALAIVGAEYVLGWLPRGTHRWEKFVTPDELTGAVRAAGLVPGERAGVVYDPFSRGWRLGRDTSVNYMVCARRRA